VNGTSRILLKQVRAQGTPDVLVILDVRPSADQACGSAAVIPKFVAKSPPGSGFRQ
jgi:hypothetical protein